MLHEHSKKEEQSEAAIKADSSNAAKGRATTEREPSERTQTATTGEEPVHMAEFISSENCLCLLTNGK